MSTLWEARRRAWRALGDVARADDRRADLVTAVVTFAAGWLTLQVGVVGLFGPAEPPPAQPWWRVVLLAAGCALIAGKRAHPVRALVGCVPLAVLDAWWGASLAMLLVLWDLLYSAALWAGRTARRWLWLVTSALVVAGTVAATAAARDPRAVVLGALQFGALLLVPMWWATNVRQKSELAALERQRADLAAEQARLAERQAALERQRAADLERLADLGRHEAVRAERAAMARDLHDAIASHLSAIAIHAGAALAAPGEPGRDRVALEQVRSGAVSSLAEMRAMILLLRSETRGEDDAVAAPGRITGVAALKGLLAAARAAGAEVALEDPDDVAGSTLPVAVDQALHRIAQEALTNVAKHAPGVPATLRLRRDGDVVELVLRNGAGASRAARDPAMSGGAGLLTMRERAAGLGGVLTAGPVPGGGWQVRARLPLWGAAVPAEARR